MRRPLLLAAVLVLAALWLGPLPERAPRQFSAHMTLHMGVVAVAAPLLAFALSGGPLDPARRWPRTFNAIVASLVELVVVWGWHTPTLHHVARTSAAGLVAEQAAFLAAGFWVWMSAFGGEAGRAGDRAAAGVVALLLTSMHMTLLGALIALSPRPLFVHADALTSGPTWLAEQHLGGAIMLFVGGISYLLGGLWLSAALLARRRIDASLSRRQRSSP